MRTVAIPTDFSFQTLKAMQLSLQLFPNDTIQFLLFSYSELPTDTQDLLFLPSREETLTVEGHDDFNRGICLLMKRHAHQIETVTYDHFWGTLPFVAKHLNDTKSIDLLLLPQSEGFPDYDGQVSALIKMNRCPLLLVPDAYTGEFSSRIGWVVNQDFDPEVYLQISQTLFSGGEPEILFMSTASDQGIERLRSHLVTLLGVDRKFRKLSFAFYRHGEDNQAHVDTTIRHQVDIIVLQQRHRWFTLKARDPLAKDIVLSSPVPVLVFPQNHAVKAA
jgi:hypothetical protein